MSLMTRITKLVNNPYSCIPFDHPILTYARELIPPERWPDTWVAGSAATRFGQNADVDVWITNVCRTVDPWTVLPCNEGRPAPANMDEYEHLCIKVYNNLEEKLQIMATHDDIHFLLANFDISVHCGAVNILTGEQIRGKGYQEKVTIVHWLGSMPILTLGRYINFSKRYNDFSGILDTNVQNCASSAFNLKTNKQMQDMLQYCYIDKGL